MRRRVLTSVFLLSALVAVGFAQEAAKKIAVINPQEVLEKSVEGKKVIARLEEKNNQNQTEIAKMDEDIRRLESRLNTQRLTLTQEALMQLTSDLEKKRTERKRFAEDSTQDLRELQFRLFNKVQNELIPIIQEIGKERDLDIIFDISKVLPVYFNPVIDITAEVITKYDASKAGK
ncbi:MAG: OmpH family outer membrane protein [Candidatus Aminicenantes bacterium]|nr:OmpH family outer membrane protein [Candidatus Aminicenantes bacterium]